MNFGALETFEIERKYQVDGAAVLPDADKFAVIGLAPDQAEAHALFARYFDTPTGELAANRFALRSRAGGKDAGWHLKAKSDDGARELMWPPSEHMPAGLLEEVHRLIGVEGATRLRAIATLRTQRTTTVLRDASGTQVVELADDLVDASNEQNGRQQQWREWEAELLPGTDELLLDLIEPLLAAAGATRVHGTSKIQRTMQTGTLRTGNF